MPPHLAAPAITMPSLPALRTLLATFTSSPSRLSVIYTHPPTSPPLPLKTLFVLDSSFNPPTIAHLSLCTSALLDDACAKNLGGPKRLLLLLAIQNADKAPKPAAFEQRVAMMGVFAQDIVALVRELVRSRKCNDADDGEQITVDVGITKEPYFLDKATAIAACSAYPGNPEQVHLTGYDTLIRLLDTKYYPPTHTLAPLAPLFAAHRVCVTRRNGFGASREQQDGYIAELARGGRENEGGRREWAGRIELVEGEEEGEEVSSTAVRRGLQGDGEGWRRMVTKGVGEWVEREGVYR